MLQPQHVSENILPYGGEEDKGAQIRRMFDAIARTYDRLNHLLSFGLDRSWRRRGIAFLKPFAPATILDVATGTGDLAVEMRRRLGAGSITGADISERMMDIGRRKAEAAGLSAHIRFERQDAMALTYGDDSFDAVTVAFGIRNFADIRRGLSEMHRVLKSGGHLMAIELSTPGWFPAKQLYRLYSGWIIPAAGRFVSKEKNAYSYLPASVRAVPQGKEMAELLTEAGFTNVSVRTFTFGVCSLYTGKK